MAKKYACSTAGCKMSFQKHFALTAHLSVCKKGLRPGRDQAVKCPECGVTYKKNGLGAHRRAKHGVAGTSRWAVRTRRRAGKMRMLPASRTMATSGAGVVNVDAEFGLDGSSSQTLNTILELASEHRAKAERLEKIAKELQEML